MRLSTKSERLYLLLAGLFVAALVVCNLVANKFITLDLGFRTFIISVGVLPYPLTFLITDILSEIYGRKRTNFVVFTGFAASVFVLFVLWLGHQFPAIPDSPVDNATFLRTFGNSWRVVAASMTAYLVAQLADIRLFHFWKDLTKGRHLWLRNNGSTIFSQLIDTFLVVTVLFIGVKSWEEMWAITADGWLFKVLMALLDTPLFYLAVYLCRRYLPDMATAANKP
ncbi:MAG: queuosine precursor transporter [Flavobacteriales bacterium]|nr:queuosine precursor transporter [Flavobacteriales bacterium]